MKTLTILDNLKKKNLKKEETDVITIEGAIFLTYSMESKTILSALISMFAEEENCEDENKSSTEKNGDIIQKWQILLQKGMNLQNECQANKNFLELQEKVAFVCNDGYDKSMASPIYYYTKELTYYYKWKSDSVPNTDTQKENQSKYSFHPKLYIVKYRRNDILYFRFMIGSMNLVNSKNKEFISVFDVQAFEENTDGTLVNCNILNKLLNVKAESYYCSENIQGTKSSKLGKVIKNLGMDTLFFEKDAISRIYTFPLNNEEVKKKLKSSSKIITPFLSKSIIEELSEKIEVYTMESELKKQGYVICEEDTKKEVVSFFVYHANEDEKLFSHMKMYFAEDGIYAGSLNLTKSAFEKNKEILFRLDKDAKFVEELEAYLKKNYQEKKFLYQKKDVPASMKDIFRKNVEDFVFALEQTMDLKEKSVTLSIKKDCKFDIKNFEKNLEKRLKEKVQIQISKTDTLEIKIAPFLCNDKQLSVAELSKKGCLCWKIGNRLKMDDRFSFFLYLNGKEKVQFHYQIKTITKESMEEKQQFESVAINMMLYHLSTLLANKNTTSKTITKETTQIENGIVKNDSVTYIRRLLPTLEQLLKKNLQCEILSLVELQNQMERIRYIQELINDKTLSEEERAFLGLGKMNRKMIENLIMQRNLLIEELLEN